MAGNQRFSSGAVHPFGRRPMAVGGILLALALAVSSWMPISTLAVSAPADGVSDDFGRVVANGWGTAPAGGSYSASTSSAAMSVDSTVGLMNLKQRGASATAASSAVALLDTDIKFRVKTNKTATGKGQNVLVMARRVNSGTEYRVRLRFAPNGSVWIQPLRFVNGTRKAIGSEVRVAGLTRQAGYFVWVRVQVVDTDPTRIATKVWKGSTEPKAWTHTVTDNAAALKKAGSVALRSKLANNTTNAPVRYAYDDLSVSNGGFASATTSSPAPEGTYAFDDFGRSLTSGWGKADVGGSYTLSGPKADYSVNNARGRISLPKSGVMRAALLPEVSKRDVDLRVNFTLNKRPSAGSTWIYGVARGASGNTEYRAKVRIQHNGVVFVSASRVLSGKEVAIGTEVKLATSYSAGTTWTLHARFVSAAPSALAVRAWPATQSAPLWQYTALDSTATLQTAGLTGLRAYSSSAATNAPFAMTFADLNVTTAGDPPVSSPTPSPTATPTAAPTASPTASPTAAPTASPTAAPTPSPTAAPTATPTAAPTATPTAAPTATPTATPTPTPAPANAYYVSTTGNDSNAGTLNSPWRTLQKAADTVSAGATVLIRGGTYAGFTMRRSGTASAPITFTAYGSEKPVVDGKGLVQYTIRLYLVKHIRITGLTVQGGYADKHHGGGIMVDNSSHILVRNNLLRENKAFGVRSQNSTYVTIDDNEMTKNAVGVHIGNLGQGTFVTNNRIHHNDKMMTNTPTSENAHDDAGAEGVAIVKTTGRVDVSGNLVWANRALSYDYGWDGGAFSIYGASNWHIYDNVTWNSRNVLETGTDANRTPCDGNSFTRNINYGATTADRTVGMVLRCASNTLIANNTFHDTQYFVFDISHFRGGYGGSVEGLKIVNNVIWVNTGKVYGIETDPLPSSVVIDHNLVYNSGPGYLATVVGRGGTKDLATFRSWTGFEAHGIQADPRFVDAANRDYGLRADSPAVDSGRHVSGVTDGYAGSAPDRGGIERR